MACGLAQRCFVLAITHLAFSDPTTAYLDDSISRKKKKVAVFSFVDVNV